MYGYRGRAVNRDKDFFLPLLITTTYTKSICGASVYFAPAKHFKDIYIWHVFDIQLK